jgi:hypothetical protein
VLCVLWAHNLLKSGAHNCGDFVHLNGSLDSVTVASEQAGLIYIDLSQSNIQNILDHTRHTSRCFQEHSRTYYCDLVAATTVEYTQLNKLSCIMHAVIQVYRQVLPDCTHTRKQTALLFLTGVPPHGCISTSGTCCSLGKRASPSGGHQCLAVALAVFISTLISGQRTVQSS